MDSIREHPEDWDKHFKLTADIDLADYKGTGFHIIGYYKDESDKKPFAGVFNGNGRTISHFTYASTGVDRIGLFGYISGPNAQIKNLIVADPNINGGDGNYIGALVGHLGGGVITDCSVRGGRVAGGEMVGGLVGQNGLCRPITSVEEKPCEAGTLKGCDSTTAVLGITAVGGLVGSNDGAVTDCSAAATVTGDYGIGGMVGVNGDTITNSHAAGLVSGTRKIGGLVGDNWGGICGSYSAGTISGQENIGGLVGDNNGGSITVCYSTSTVDGSSVVGGLAGINAGNISRSYSAGTVTGDLYIGGLAGENASRISGCYSAASVSAQYGHAGGLAGANDSNGSVINSYASGGVTSSVFVGGLLGSNDGIVMRCYAKSAVAGLSDAGGLVGYSTDQACALFSYWDTKTSGQAASAGGVGETTVDMQKISTFDGWGACNADGPWTINEGKDYPRLLWENQPGTVIEAVQLSDLLTGSGKENDAFLVRTAEQLNAIGLFPCEWDKRFKLMADINLSAYVGTQFNMIGFYRIPFTGVFDGNAHVVSNFTYSSTGSAYVGLFGCVGSLNAQVKNLGLVNANVSVGARDCAGALAGCLKEGAITNCYVDPANVSGLNSIAGMVGYNEQGTIENCYSTGTIEAGASVGGLVGTNWRGAVTDCHAVDTVIGVWGVGGLVGDNSGTITGGYSASNVAAGDLVGGLVGANSGKIENTYSSGQTTGNGKVGGLVGSNQGKLASCHSTGNVNGDASVGGLAGFNSNADVASCYSTGNVYGRLSAGGLIGFNSSKTTVTSCYSTGAVSGYEWIGGLVGRNEGSVAKSYSAGSVSGTMEIGGLVGLNFGQAAVASCYATGNVSGNGWVGGLVGTNNSSITKCYSSGNVTGIKGTVGGLVGFNYGTAAASFWDTQTSGQPTGTAGTGKTTTEMKTKKTFTSAGWDFVGETANGVEDIWQIVEGQDYPRLSWQ
jgi:hypothetical protein